MAGREDRVKFWAAIAGGIKTEESAREAGVSSPVAFRWFRHAGGVNPCLPPTVSGRYLSFAEREDVAAVDDPRSDKEAARVFKAQGFGVRELVQTGAPAVGTTQPGSHPYRRVHLPASATRVHNATVDDIRSFADLV